MLAITDGKSQGSNLAIVNDDKSKVDDENAEKRRKNIIKSRELR